MNSTEVYETIRNTVSMYIRSDFTDDTNLLGITSVRNIIYILIDLEKRVNLEINDSFINEIKDLSVKTISRVIPKYLK